MAVINKLGIGCVMGALLLAMYSVATQAQPSDDGQNNGHEFDFGIGAFKTHIKRLEHPLTGSNAWAEWSGTVVTRKLWDGGGNLEELSAGNATEHLQGITLRLYDAKTHQWNLYWASKGDGALGTPMVGEFKQGRGVFYNKDTIGGHAVMVRDTYSGATANTYHFEEAYSPDGGKTWETHFIADLTRDASNAAMVGR
jgi:hypothetical protein